MQLYRLQGCEKYFLDTVARIIHGLLFCIARTAVFQDRLRQHEPELCGEMDKFVNIPEADPYSTPYRMKLKILIRLSLSDIHFACRHLLCFACLLHQRHS